MVLGTMALLFGMGVLGLNALDKEGKHDILIRTNTKDPQLYVERLIGTGFLEANPNKTKEIYLNWLDKNFVLSDAETKHWEQEFDNYKNKLIQQRQSKAKYKYRDAKSQYYRTMQDNDRKRHRERCGIHKHYFKTGLKAMMNDVLEETFIGNEIDKAWVTNGREEFLCMNTKLKRREIQKYYKICWNYIHNNDKDRF